MDLKSSLFALKNFISSAYFLLILDIKMPKMNGFELYLEIKKIDNKVKVCFLTALSEFQEYQAFKREVSLSLAMR
ncbi:MAG: hypothetical protein DLM72_19610 [Candidatus Nitrosopolaris wilkensis]|nr:MAG: hypothetical protein DLM72_19610 [Candidatus Nitrosopolaris wilkensis]